jgi:hypothetical protein
MPEQVPISEVRRVVIEYEIRVPTGGAARTSAPAAPSATEVTPELVDAIKNELIRSGSRNPDIFGGRA